MKCRCRNQPLGMSQWHSQRFNKHQYLAYQLFNVHPEEAKSVGGITAMYHTYGPRQFKYEQT